jgi:hypothetical protein
MKRFLPTLGLVLSAAVCLAADDNNLPADRNDQAVSSDRAIPSDSRSSSVQPGFKTKDDVEVVSKSGAALTVKMDGSEANIPVTGGDAGKQAAALRVVRPGDKVRLFYRDEDANGRPSAVEGFVITKPKKIEESNTSGKNRQQNQNNQDSGADTRRP